MKNKILEQLKELWQKYPEERFGQPLFNHTRIGTRTETGTINDPFYYEDKEILSDLIKSNEK